MTFLVTTNTLDKYLFFYIPKLKTIFKRALKKFEMEITVFAYHFFLYVEVILYKLLWKLVFVSLDEENLIKHQNSLTVFFSSSTTSLIINIPRLDIDYYFIVSLLPVKRFLLFESLIC